MDTALSWGGWKKMSENEFRLTGEERLVQALRSLYTSNGYTPFKMSRFEEYDLYAGNKDFLVSGDIITFTDTDGSLMALKPDVTLSIVKASREEEGCVSRISYDEKVYRVSSAFGTFREITQVGIECLGDVEDVQIGEVAILAQKSLRQISDESMLTISHMGITEGFLGGISSSSIRTEALSYMEAKNISGMEKLAIDNPECASSINSLRSLLSFDGSSGEMIAMLRQIGAEKGAVDELEKIVSVLDEDSVRIDFSVLGGMNYYNGITFRGYVRGVPEMVVSGGQYDKLMARMGKKAKAVGFAVYMDVLERLLEEDEEYNVDVALVYDESVSMDSVLEKAEKMRKSGKSVATMKKVPQKLKCREVEYIGGGENA
ncbi:MAG: ATP phosphoribosyltransferase regulatory subunit [Candidatus Ornithospirochaeta sp.]